MTSRSPIALPVLGQAYAAAASILFWVAVLLAVIVALAVVALWLRRRLMVAEESEGGIGFTLGDLRRLHREGKMSDEEFNTAKAAMLARTRAVIDAPKPAGKVASADLGPELLGGATTADEDDDDGDDLGESTDNSEDAENPDNGGDDSGPTASR
jgi:hypothetical protein